MSLAMLQLTANTSNTLKQSFNASPRLQVDYHRIPPQATTAVPCSRFLQQLIQWMLSPEPRERHSTGQVLQKAGMGLQAWGLGSGDGRA